MAISEKSGKPFFETQATYMTFLIGRNPQQNAERPYAYVPLRHVPAAPTSYQFYGEDLLPNFNSLPTWVYATPHNIQRNTPQNASCEACHGNPALFLTADKVKAEELKANASVVVELLPPSVDLILSTPKMPADHAEHVSNSCTACHTTGIRDALILPGSHGIYKDEDCTGCHKSP
ncbi:MAG: hypothetical protein A3K04_00270 [Gallionellales bacterium RBG_16_56_9]|nr:MAG: hypothetical protein A3K04_00270 [Gallionellales bacterium RBG_16_56_9]